MTRSASSAPDLDARWRPDGDGPQCAYAFDGTVCDKSGPHYCQPRADRKVAFFHEVLVHVKGVWAGQAFLLEDWQEHGIVRPLFGEVVYSQEWGRYVRRYRLAYIVLARKNGKSALVSGIVLALAIGDDEPAAEVYGAAKDTKQAGKVFEPAVAMAKKSPVLSKRLEHNKNNRRLYDERTGSYIETITADALGELGHNPHGSYIDEVLSQQDDQLFHALRTAMDTRHQPLMLLLTTETNDPQAFGASEIDEAERIQEDPSRAPHIFPYVRKAPKNDDELERLRRLFGDHPDLPVSTDPWDEANWRWPNPALGSFKSLASMREQALEARNEPAKEASFRQYHLNQRQSKRSRFISSDVWSACGPEIWPEPEWKIGELEGELCWAGMDLSSRLDLTSWGLLFDNGVAWWRHWIPEATMPLLDRFTSGRASVWDRDGWLTVTEGEVVDYQQVYEDIETDHNRFAIARLTYDRWSAEPARQEIERRTGLTTAEAATTYKDMTGPMHELQRMLRVKELNHLGNPLVAWMADCVEAKRDGDRMRPVKPDRDADEVRIDGIVTLLLAIDGRMRHSDEEPTGRRKIRAKSIG